MAAAADRIAVQLLGRPPRRCTWSGAGAAGDPGWRLDAVLDAGPGAPTDLVVTCIRIVWRLPDGRAVARCPGEPARPDGIMAGINPAAERAMQGLLALFAADGAPPIAFASDGEYVRFSWPLLLDRV